MKRSIYFLFLLLFITNIHSLELIKETKLERYKNIPYKDKINEISYDLKKEQLLLNVPIKKEISISQVKSTVHNFYAPLMFSKDGKFLGEVGKFNSYDKDGIITAFSTMIIDDKINIRDEGINGILKVFSNKKPFKYMYSVKNVLPDPYFGVVTFIRRNTAFLTQTREFITEIKDKNNYYYRVDQYSKTAVGKIIDTNNPNLKSTSHIKRILPFKKYFDQFWHDKTLFKNKRLKKIISKDKKHSSLNFQLLQLAIFLGPKFYKSIFIFDNTDNFYASLSRGSEINYYDKDGNLLNTYLIDKIENYKEKEIILYKDHIIKKLKKSFKKFNEQYFLSELMKGFYDSKNNFLILTYRLSDDFLKLANLPKAKTYLLVYSLDKHKAVSDFIPINFIPVNFDSDKRELIGVQQRDNDIYLQFYKWEY